MRVGDADARGDQIGVEPGLARVAAAISTRSRRAPGSPPERCTCSTPSAAASVNTRDQVAASSSSSRGSSASGFEQYGQPSGQRCVSSARRPSGLCQWPGLRHAKAPAASSRPARQQLAHVGMYALARRVEGPGQVIDDRVERRLAGAALEDFDRDRVGLEDALGREQHPAALRLAVVEAHAARQPRLGVRRYRLSVIRSPNASPMPHLRMHRVCVIRQSRRQKPQNQREKRDACAENGHLVCWRPVAIGLLRAGAGAGLSDQAGHLHHAGRRRQQPRRGHAHRRRPAHADVEAADRGAQPPRRRRADRGAGRGRRREGRLHASTCRRPRPSTCCRSAGRQDAGRPA